MVDQAANGGVALALACRHQSGVVLMDLKMPVLGGIPASRHIGAELPETHVGLLTTCDTDHLVFDGNRAGAQGYLLEDADADMLVEAIKGDMNGESQLSPMVVGNVLTEFQRIATERQPDVAARADGT